MGNQAETGKNQGFGFGVIIVVVIIGYFLFFRGDKIDGEWKCEIGGWGFEIIMLFKDGECHLTEKGYDEIINVTCQYKAKDNKLQFLERGEDAMDILGELPWNYESDLLDEDNTYKLPLSEDNSIWYKVDDDRLYLYLTVEDYERDENYQILQRQ